MDKQQSKIADVAIKKKQMPHKQKKCHMIKWKKTLPLSTFL